MEAVESEGFALFSLTEIANWNIQCFFQIKEFLWAMLPCSIANSEITIAIEHHNV
jgi:hypothetical protein